jgi:hypothetical protein
MVAEWVFQNIAYTASIVFSESAKYVDLDEYGDTNPIMKRKR